MQYFGELKIAILWGVVWVLEFLITNTPEGISESIGKWAEKIQPVLNFLTEKHFYP